MSRQSAAHRDGLLLAEIAGSRPARLTVPTELVIQESA